MTGDEVRIWTLDAVVRERPDVAPMARLHAVLREAADEACAAAIEAHGAPTYPGAPAVHWSQGRSLLSACEGDAWVAGVRDTVLRLLDRMAAEFSETMLVGAEIGRRLREADFPWEDRVRRRLEPVPEDIVPHAALFRFLLLRAQAPWARRLALSVAPPHPDRWLPAQCPFCGVPAAVEVASAGGRRRHACVLCDAQWERADRSCGQCGTSGHAEDRVFAAKELGPVTLEACGACGALLKVVPAEQLGDEGVTPLEVLTVALDMVAGQAGGPARHETALAALFPPA